MSQPEHDGGDRDRGDHRRSAAEQPEQRAAKGELLEQDGSEGDGDEHLEHRGDDNADADEAVSAWAPPGR